MLSNMKENEEKSFKKLSEIKLKFIPKAWKREAMAHKTSLKGSSLKVEILARLSFFFKNLTNWFSYLKTWVDVSWVGAHLWGFFQLQKCICVGRDVIIRDEA